MVEYIEREKVLDAITVDGFEHFSGCLSSSEVRLLETIRDSVSEVPTADVVEVVRCKDCKHSYINSFSAQSGVALCKFWSNRAEGNNLVVQQDDYCSYGERKCEDG